MRLSRTYVADDAARDLEDGKAWLLARLDRGVHPLDGMGEGPASPQLSGSGAAKIAVARAAPPVGWTAALAAV